MSYSPSTCLDSYLSFLGEDLMVGTEAAQTLNLDPGTLAAAEGVDGGHKSRPKRARLAAGLTDDFSDDDGDAFDDEQLASRKPGGKKKKGAAATKACREKARREKINDRWGSRIWITPLSASSRALPCPSSREALPHACGAAREA